MTKKRKKWPDLDQKLERPWCYYCERDFDDLKILISHQKAKHFKCDRCGRRLNTAGGLSVHMNQVHKESLTQVENAIAGRSSLDIEIFGMEGVPQDVVDAHNQQVTHKHFEEEQERARVTGNPIRGLYANGSGPGTKRPKVVEILDDLVSRSSKYLVDKANGTLPLEVQPDPSPPAVQTRPAPPPSQTPSFPVGGHPFPASGTAQFPPSNVFPNNPPPPFQPPFAGQQPQFSPGGIPPRPGSIPGQGLPQRPPFAGVPGGPFIPGQAGNAVDPTIAASVDELIINAATASAGGPAEAAPDRKSKKDKNMKLVYSDDIISPEEKMATLQRYAAYVRV